MTRTLAALAALSLLAAAPAAAQQASEPSYSPSYGTDRAEIEDLMARYLFAIDYADWDAYVATFAEDGELEFAAGNSNAHAALLAPVTRFSGRSGRV